MNFSEAFEELKKGNKITRPCWEHMFYLTEDDVEISEETEEEIETLSFTPDDLLADDWEVVE